MIKHHSTYCWNIPCCILAVLCLFLHVPRCASQCSKVLVHGNKLYTNQMGVYGLGPDLYDDRNYWKKLDGEWYIYGWWSWDWEIGTPLGGSDDYFGTLDMVELYVHDETDIWRMDEVDGYWGDVAEFKAECYIEDNDYLLRPGICPQDHKYIIESIADDSYETTQEDCKARCDADASCVTYSISRYGCKPATQPCLFTEIPPGNGFTFVNGMISDIAVGSPAYQSSTDPDPSWDATAAKAVDGILNAYMVLGKSCSQTLPEARPWWMVDITPGYFLLGVVITSRRDCCGDRLHDVVVGALSSSDIDAEKTLLDAYDFSNVHTCKTIEGVIPSETDYIIQCEKPLYATAVVIYMQPYYTAQILTLCEVQPLLFNAGKYMFIKEKMTRDEAEASCNAFGGGNLAVIDTEEELLLIQEFIESEKVSEDFWLGQKEGSAAVNPGKISSLPNGVPWNVARDIYATTCTAASDAGLGRECEAAFDGDDTTEWVSLGSGVGQWIKLSFRYPMKIFKIRLLQRLSSETSFKSMELHFSDDPTTTITLEKRNGIDDEDIKNGYYWDEIDLDPQVTTKTLKFQALSTHDAASDCGFGEIQAWGGPPYGYIPKAGQCEGHTLSDMYGDFESCEDACRGDTGCVGFVIYVSGDNEDLCELLDDVCGTLTENTDAFTFEKSDTGGLTAHVGTSCDDKTFQSVMADFNVVDMYSACNEFPECTGFRYGDGNKFIMGHCTEVFSEVDFTFDLLADPTSVTSDYVGCYPEEEVFETMIYHSYSGTDMTPDLCITKCKTDHDADFAGVVEGDSCTCGDSFGSAGTFSILDGECRGMCLGDRMKACGERPTMTRNIQRESMDKATSIYVTDSSSVLKDCYIADLFNYLSGKSDGKITTHLEYCQRNAQFLCERIYDFCITEPCVHGTCESTDLSFNCTCTPGYTGKQCDTNIDDCASLPCINGQCQDDINQFTCLCDKGYEGDLCETDIDECAINPCENGGTCENNIGEYSCNCIGGFTGVNCEAEIDECSSSPCLKGTCVDEMDGFLCDCYPGWEGARCQTNIDECDSGPCKNDATCLDFENRYSCECKAGYTGPQCDTEIKECISDPCQNSAVCNELENAYSCTCEDGFTGTHCETDINECAGRPCKNNAECIDGVNGHTCLCPAGFDGFLCDIYVGNPGVWAGWGNWSTCSQTCGQGLRHRSRDCIPDYPELGAGKCSGSASESSLCSEKECAPIDGQWGSWFPHSECSTTCGPGIVNVTRLCDAPEPQFGGEECQGITSKLISCQNQRCKYPVENCGNWSQWTNCTGSCDSAIQEKKIVCTQFVDDEITNVTLVQQRGCQPKTCQATQQGCHVCEKSFSLSGIDKSGCSGEQQCGGGTSMCAYTYGVVIGNTAMLRKTCATATQCDEYVSQRMESPTCQDMRILSLPSMEMLLSDISQDYQMDDVMAAWRSLNETCSICCEGNKCNAGLFSREADIYQP